ncbi:ycf20-like protein isoform X2 [Apium graveolens]|uniref:ycf20-like protein isoform X2 n=1 Tax=Apium graveolens TaxID=4045 RepID=UPI003D7AE959
MSASFDLVPAPIANLHQLPKKIKRQAFGNKTHLQTLFFTCIPQDYNCEKESHIHHFLVFSNISECIGVGIIFLLFVVYSIDFIMLHVSLPFKGNKIPQASFHIVRHCNTVLNWKKKQIYGCVSRPASNPGNKSVSFLRKSSHTKRHDWKVALALDTGSPGNGGQESSNNDGPGLGQTRLGRLVSAGGRQLLEKLNSTRKKFPMKIFLLLLGFYTANALATILGQTGDWDVLVAGVVVAAIEGIGMLMYRKPSSPSTGQQQSLIMMINYWKAGVCLGLFVDAFKLGS